MWSLSNKGVIGSAGRSCLRYTEGYKDLGHNPEGCLWLGWGGIPEDSCCVSSGTSTDAQLGTTVMGISAVLFHTAWTGAYESFDTNPLIGAGLAHQFSDPQIGRSVVWVLNEVELPVIRAFSGAYQWLNLAGFTINAELFESHFRFEGLAISCFCFSGSRFHSRSAEVPIRTFIDRRSGRSIAQVNPEQVRLKLAPFGISAPQGLFKVTSTSDAGLLSAFWAAHIGFVSIPAS